MYPFSHYSFSLHTRKAWPYRVRPKALNPAPATSYHAGTMEILPIPNPWPGAQCFFLSETGSTMHDARELALAGCPEGSLVTTDFQNSGRGRIEGRTWLSPPGENLMFTLVLAAKAVNEAALPLKAGLAVQRAIRSMAWIAANQEGAEVPRLPAVEVKWPNDILVGGKKLAGIICEAGSRAVLIGIGVNANQTVFDPFIEGTTTSLRIASGCEVDRWKLLSLFLKEMEAVRRNLTWRKELESCLWRRGLATDFLPGRATARETKRGLIEGIDAEGGLVLSIPGEGTRSFFSGEIRLLRDDQTL